MNNAIKLTVTIECDNRDFSTTVEIVDIKFADLSRDLFDNEDLQIRLKKALKVVNGTFKMLTFDLFSYNAENYYDRKEIFSGIRYITSFTGYQRSPLQGTSYTGWNPATKKTLSADLASMVQDGNSRFLQMVRETNQPSALLLNN